MYEWIQSWIKKIIGEEKVETALDYRTLHLMMLSEYITIASNTVRVDYKEVTDDGMVKFTGEKVN